MESQIFTIVEIFALAVEILDFHVFQREVSFQKSLPCLFLFLPLVKNPLNTNMNVYSFTWICVLSEIAALFVKYFFQCQKMFVYVQHSKK